MTTIVEHLEAFLADMAHRRKLRPNTVRAYRYDLQRAAIALPMSLDEMSIDGVETWLYTDQPATSTSERRASSLACFFAWAQRHNLCTTNPTRLCEPSHAARRLPNPIRNPEHLRQLDTAIQSLVHAYRPIFTILREAGMRASEVLNLNVHDVHLQVGRESLRLRETKNGFERSVILDPKATPPRPRVAASRAASPNSRATPGAGSLSRYELPADRNASYALAAKYHVRVGTPAAGGLPVTLPSASLLRDEMHAASLTGRYVTAIQPTPLCQQRREGEL